MNAPFGTGSQLTRALNRALSNSGHNVAVTSIVEALRHLHDEDVIDGTGISLLHRLPVWLTASGQSLARALNDDLGGWRRVA